LATKKASAGRSSRKSSSRKSSGRRSSRSAASSRRSGSTRHRRTTSKKKSSRRRYGSKAQKEVRTEMHHLKRGEHKNRKQAIAIGLSKARRAGGKVPSKKAA